MKKIGLIGGLSWVSTAQYYRLINQITQETLGGVNSAHILLESVNRQEYVDAVIDRQDKEFACNIIRQAAVSLENGGASFIVISCNDVHRFVPRIQLDISIPFLHIVDATAKVIDDTGIKTVALMGVRKTMEERFYPDILEGYGIETIVPSELQKKIIHDAIYDELVKDVFLEETRVRYQEIINQLGVAGAEGVILGCTEIPLLLGEEHIELPSFSTTDIHCRAAVNMAVDC